MKNKVIIILFFVCILAVIHVSAQGGQCPPPDNRVCAHYHDQCTSDAKCPSGSLCCLQPGCGNECKVAIQ
uniref:U12-Theraphotoxin-Sfo1b_1 n=1 Tax=Selenotholus foelschei TaxID=1905327 RepID=A0A482ZAF5_9ARAC